VPAVTGGEKQGAHSLPPSKLRFATSLVKGQCGEYVGRGEIGVEQTAQLALCVPLIEPLLNLGG